jgi:hypothetical protein
VLLNKMLQLAQPSVVQIGAWYRLAADVGASGFVRQRWAAQLSADPLGRAQTRLFPKTST